MYVRAPAKQQRPRARGPPGRAGVRAAGGARTSFELSDVAAHFCSSDRSSARSLPPMVTAAERTCCTASAPAARNARMMACSAQPCSHDLFYIP